MIINEFTLIVNNYKSNLLNLNPRNVLNRGYSFILNADKKPITSLSDVAVGKNIYSILKDGEIISEVKNKNEKKNEE